jgi:hypothetical protein
MPTASVSVRPSGSGFGSEAGRIVVLVGVFAEPTGAAQSWRSSWPACSQDHSRRTAGRLGLTTADVDEDEFIANTGRERIPALRPIPFDPSAQ